MALRSSDRPGDSTSPPAEGERLGELLSSARQRLGLTLQQISSETKIPVWHLAALEREQLAALPAAFYRRAEVRAFARAVGVEERLALDLLERLEARIHPAPPPPPAPPPRVALSRARLELLAGLGIVAAVVLGRVIWERQVLDNPEDRPPIVDLTNGRVVPAVDVFGPADDGPDVLTVSLPATPVGASTALDGAAPTSGVDADVAEPVAPPAPAGPTELLVTTDPPGARVTVDGIGWGEAPVTVRHLESGAKRVRVTHDGFAPVERVVHVADGQKRQVAIRLTPRQ